jgi:hypothetical protein
MSDEPVLRASDAEREQAVATLRDAAAEGLLTLEEFSERVDEAYGARTKAELERVTRELPDTAPPRKRPHRFTISIFGGVDRKGRWRVPRRGFVLDMFGGSDFDLREAQLDEPVATFVVVSLFGGSDFYVPEGVEVDLRGFGLFSGNDEHGSEGRIVRGAPLVRIIALGLFSGVDVWHLPAGAAGSRKELRRAARDRERGG